MLPPVGAAPAITTRKSGTRCARSSSRSWKLSTKSFRGGWCNGVSNCGDSSDEPASCSSSSLPCTWPAVLRADGTCTECADGEVPHCAAGYATSSAAGDACVCDLCDEGYLGDECQVAFPSPPRVATIAPPPCYHCVNVAPHPKTCEALRKPLKTFENSPKTSENL